MATQRQSLPEGPAIARPACLDLGSPRAGAYASDMLTQKAKYALQALRVLAAAGTEGAAQGARPTLTIQAIAERAHAPRKFLETILLDLRRHGFVDSSRGKAGGYVLAMAPADIRLSEVIRALDGPLAPIPCASLTAYRPCSDCPDPAACALRRVMREVRDATAAILDARSVADLIGPQDAGCGK